MLTIDHLMWATPDLEQGIVQFEQLTGVRAVPGGSHPGMGTRNALISCGKGKYIEIVGPDPEQDLERLPGTLGALVKARSGPGLLTFAMQCADLEAQGKRAEGLGLPFQGPLAWSRAQPDGRTIHWRLGMTRETAFGAHLPFYIDWLDTPHPSATVPGGLSWIEFEVLHPQSRELQELYNGLGIGLQVRRADRPGFRAVVRGKEHEVVLTSLD